MDPLDVCWRYVQAETWRKVTGLKGKMNCWSFWTCFTSTFPSISVQVQVPSPQQMCSSQSVCQSHHLRLVPDMLLALWNRAGGGSDTPPSPVECLSECRSRLSGYFKHIIQPTLVHSPLPASHEDSWVPVSSLRIISRYSMPMAVSGTLDWRLLVRAASVSLGTLGRFLGKGRSL